MARAFSFQPFVSHNGFNRAWISIDASDLKYGTIWHLLSYIRFLKEHRIV
ncbi:uncharacterized protein PHALS_07999 [Plasmopara halstedii]|uniref:Uncharacterized protein n=1 Tax=Plasmopara halstedii TaxID=4781 RepID=A0A0P1B6X9_PLAHL|nr:uncharacterized protein PHALS_07999 [Plasmopara halstedii]CEG50277.1 hypothetical protein PHALS_07999 [Plasmopara halstedii]|eukprot:XP_024586646.1 hypothetical protein PHALS_07999 [Plasmopara halstedii]